MKKHLFALLFFLLIFSGLKSQQIQGFKFGVEAGFNLANTISTITVFGSEAKNAGYFYLIPTYNLNGYIEYQLNQKIGFAIEPGFMQKGRSFILASGMRTQNNYIQLPVTANFYITKKLSIYCGPELAYLLNAYVKPVNHVDNLYEQYDKAFELSGFIGVNYNIYKNMDISLRYNHGLTSISDNPIGNENEEIVGKVEEYNQYFQILLRIKI